MDYISLAILGCAVVTFIPRLIPALFVDKLNFSPKFEKFLNLIPYTALAALICPGVLTVDTQLWYIGLIGAVVAAGLAWKKVPMGAIVILTVVVLITVYSSVPFFEYFFISKHVFKWKYGYGDSKFEFSFFCLKACATLNVLMKCYIC